MVERVLHALAHAADPRSARRLHANNFTGSEAQRAIREIGAAPPRPTPLPGRPCPLGPQCRTTQRGGGGRLGLSFGPRHRAAGRGFQPPPGMFPSVGAKAPGFGPGAEGLVTGDVCGEGRSAQPTEGFGFWAVSVGAFCRRWASLGSSSTHWGLRSPHVGSPACWPLLEAVKAEGHGAVPTGRPSHVL